jgi:tetratricopeptide (TPR) repeat protein/O-antigen ligase
MLQAFDVILHYGVLLLLVWTPLAFGAVHAWAYSLLEVHVFLLVAVWMLQRLVVRLGSVPDSSASPPLLFTPLALPLTLFLALLIVQLIPLPDAMLSFISPATAALYRLFLPNWPDTSATLSLAPYATREALGQWLAYTGVFFLSINTLRTPRHIQAVCWTIVGTACTMAVLGILQKLSGTDSIYWLRDTGYVNGSFFGPYINRNHFAGYQTMALMLGLGLLLAQPSRALSYVSSAWRRRVLQCVSFLSPGSLLLVCMLALMTGALALSASRGGVLSFLLSLPVLALLLRQSRLQWGRQTLLAMTLIAMVGMALWLGLTPLLMRFEQLASDPAMLSWAGRVPAFQTAWAISKDFPVLGIGYEAFSVLAPRYQPITEHYLRFVYTHNDFLQLLAETGWIGFSLLIGGLGLVVQGIVRRRQQRHDPFVHAIVSAGLAALFAFGLHALVDFNFHVPANALLFTIVLALTWACAHLPHREEPAPGQDAESIRQPGYVKSVLLPGLGLLAALGLAFGALQTAVADFLYPQHEILQPDHWTYRVAPAIQRHRLHQALQWLPSHPRYWSRLAELDAQEARGLLAANELTEDAWPLITDKLQQAAISYERALRQHPTEPYTQVAWLHVVQDLAMLHPPALPSGVADVSAWYPRVASLATSNPSIQYHLGTLRLRAAHDSLNPVTPLQFFRQAIHLDAEYDQKVLQTYRSHFSETEALRRFALTVPNTPQGHLRVARLMQDEHWDQARLHYRTALLLSESDPAILRTYGTALQRHREFTTGQKIWERLRDIAPQDATAYLGLADALYGLKDYAGAARTLQQLVERFPMHVEYHVRLANAYVQSGQTAEAEVTWKRAIDLQPHAAKSYEGLARLYQSRGDLAGAIFMMQRAASLEPGYHHALATLYEQSGHRHRAEQMYKQLVARQTSDPSVFYKLGVYAQQDGQLLQAIAYFRRAVHLQPDHTGFRRALEQVVQQGVKP